MHAASVEAGELDPFRRENSKIAVVQKKHVARVTQDRGHVRGNEILSIANADHDRGTGTRRNNLVRIETGDHSQGEHAGQLFYRFTYGLLQIALKVLFHQV